MRHTSPYWPTVIGDVFSERNGYGKSVIAHNTFAMYAAHVFVAVFHASSLANSCVYVYPYFTRFVEHEKLNNFYFVI